MEHTEQNYMGPDQGCLVVERGPDGARILFADMAARAMMGLSIQDLPSAQVEQAVEGIPVTMRGLDENHDLWVLGGPDGHVEELFQMNAELELALREAEEAIALEGRRFSPLLTARLRDSGTAGRLQTALEAGWQAACRRMYDDAGRTR